MRSLKILQVGMGPLGVSIARFIPERSSLLVVGAVDKNPDLAGKGYREVTGVGPGELSISDSIGKAIGRNVPDIAILTTVSDLRRITPQIEELVSLGIPVVSSCEELSFPWQTNPALAKQIDEAARNSKVPVLGTGVNPGFLMDALPTTLTAISQDVQSITVKRLQNAQSRRLPFQKKIGAGLSVQEFNERVDQGVLRHVGLTESIHMIAHRIGWQLDRTEDLISPLIARKDVRTETMTIAKGDATGVRQIGNGFLAGEIRIQLVFEASVDQDESFDEIIVEGNPRIHSRIEGGINGDVATCAIILNAIPRVLEAAPGLHTMVDIAPVSFFR